MGSDLQSQIDAVKGAPLLYLAAVLIVGAIIWAVVDRLYSHRIEGLKERIDGLKEQIDRKAESSSPPVADSPAEAPPVDPSVKDNQERTSVPPDVTPANLHALFEGVTQHEGRVRAKPYLGKWMKITGTVKDVMYEAEQGWLVPVSTEGSGWMEATILRFDADETPKVEMLRKGQTITAEGKIDDLTNLWLSVKNCKLLD